MSCQVRRVNGVFDNNGIRGFVVPYSCVSSYSAPVPGACLSRAVSPDRPMFATANLPVGARVNIAATRRRQGARQD